MIAELLGDLVSALGAQLAGDRGLKIAARRARRAGKFLGAARLRSGKAEGLSRTWKMAEFPLAAGSLTFKDTVLSVTAATRRAGELRMRDLAGNPVPDPAIIDLTCDGADVELAVISEDADRVITALSGV